MGKNTMNGCRVNWLAALFSLVLARGRGRGGGVWGYWEGGPYARMEFKVVVFGRGMGGSGRNGVH